MRKSYKHPRNYDRKKPKKRNFFFLKSLLSVLLFLGIFLASDRIAGVKSYVIETLNKSYSIPDVKTIKEKTAESAEEIKEAVSVFKADNDNQTDKTNQDIITFRPPYIGEITSPYGEREHPTDKSNSFHTGIDIAGNFGDTVISAAPGKVKKVGCDDINGNYLTIEHNEKFSTSYAHMSKISVIEGEEVDSNTKIGEIGSSGISTGSHLHFCIFEDGKTIDPEIYIKLNHRDEQ